MVYTSPTVLPLNVLQNHKLKYVLQPALSWLADDPAHISPYIPPPATLPEAVLSMHDYNLPRSFWRPECDPRRWVNDIRLSTPDFMAALSGSYSRTIYASVLKPS